MNQLAGTRTLRTSAIISRLIYCTARSTWRCVSAGQLFQASYQGRRGQCQCALL